MNLPMNALLRAAAYLSVISGMSLVVASLSSWARVALA